MTFFEFSLQYSPTLFYLEVLLTVFFILAAVLIARDCVFLWLVLRCDKAMADWTASKNAAAIAATLPFWPIVVGLGFRTLLPGPPGILTAAFLVLAWGLVLQCFINPGTTQLPRSS